MLLASLEKHSKDASQRSFHPTAFVYKEARITTVLPDTGISEMCFTKDSHFNWRARPEAPEWKNDPLL